MRPQLEFSLALNNRTGKYFIGRDLLDGAADIFSENVRYWRLSYSRLPDGLLAKILGRLMTWEVKTRASSRIFDRCVPRMSPSASVIFTDPLQCLLYQLKAEDVVLVHDLGPITHPQFYAPGVDALYSKVFAEISEVKPRVIFVTASSREEFERLYGHAYGEAAVIPPAVLVQRLEGAAEPVHGVSSPFLLTVGAVGERKNQRSAIYAFQEAGLAGSGVQYVICGGPEPGFEEVKAAAERSNGVCMTGYVNDAQLRWLYSNAKGFVLPSRLEGFGIPAAEAIARGLVPLVGRHGALAEVTGPRAILVDPDSVSDIARGLVALTQMTKEDKAERLSELTRQIDRFTLEAFQSAWRSLLTAL